MSIDGISATSAASATQPAAWQQRKQDFASLVSAAQSGDMSAAQSAYSELTTKQTPPTNSPLAAVGTALQSGDASAVQKAVQTLQQARSGHHHHHHAQPATDSSQSASTAASATGATGVNMLA